MNLGNITIKTDNTEAFKAAMKSQILKGLEEVGQTAEGYAKKSLTNNGNVDTGNLRNNITHVVADNAVYIGTNVEYAPYVELGTGIHYPGGRQGGWKYEDDKGEWHFTYGSKPYPYLKPAAENHAGEYRELFESALKS